MEAGAAGTWPEGAEEPRPEGTKTVDSNGARRRPPRHRRGVGVRQRVRAHRFGGAPAGEAEPAPLPAQLRDPQPFDLCRYSGEVRQL